MTLPPDVTAGAADALLAAIIVLGVGLAIARSIGLATLLLAAQSLAVGLASAVLGVERGSGELIAVGVLTIALRALVVPWVLRRLLHASPVRHETNAYLGAWGSGVVAMVIVFASSVAVQHLTLALRDGAPHAVPVAIAEVVTGLLLVATRRKSISMVVGLLVFENGISLATISLTQGLPFLLELGAAFDLLIVMVVVQVHARRMLTTFGSLSTDRLRSLRG
jgi:hydrogenase-4 component E